MQPIDVHMIHMPNENPTWRKQCDESLAGQPINIHHINWVPGDLRKARFDGFARGSSPYVSFVDPDDYVNAGAFQQCLDELNTHQGVCGVYTLSTEIKVDDQGRDAAFKLMHPFRQWPLPPRGPVLEIHQLVVMRREAVQYVADHFYDKVPPMHHMETWMYWNMATRSPWRAVDVVGYNWRVHAKGAHNMHTSDEFERAQQTAKYINSVRRLLFS